MTYQLMTCSMTQEVNSIKKIDGDEVWYIPLAEGNRFYDEYLEWLEEGNEPLPAD